MRILLDSVSYLWPLAIVRQYEVGVYLVFGRVWKVVQPGIYPRIPWFTDVHLTSTAWEPVKTGRHDITTKGGDTLTFEAITWLRVVDAVKALTLVHDYEHGSAALAAGVLCERLSEVDPERFEPEKRGRLNTSLQGWVEKEAAMYGLEVEWVRFSTFILKPRTYRVLTDSGSLL